MFGFLSVHALLASRMFWSCVELKYYFVLEIGMPSSASHHVSVYVLCGLGPNVKRTKALKISENNTSNRVPLVDTYHSNLHSPSIRFFENIFPHSCFEVVDLGIETLGKFTVFTHDFSNWLLTLYNWLHTCIKWLEISSH